MAKATGTQATERAAEEAQATQAVQAPRTVRIDCREMATRAQAHDVLARELGLPAHYGRNLDALFDCLAEMANVRIVLEHADALATLGAYGELLLNTLREAADANPGLSVCLEAPADPPRA